ncbi:MAG: DUF349 domain-containing protein [Bacteroidia bacterium]
MNSNETTQPNQELPEDQNMSSAVENAESAAASTSEALENEVQAADLTEATENAVETAEATVADAVEAVEEKAADVAETAEATVTEAVESVEEKAADVAEAAEEKVAEVTEAAEATVEEVTETVEEKAAEVAESVEEAVAETAEAASEAADAETSEEPEAAPAVVPMEADEGQKALIGMIDEAMTQPDGLEELLGKATPQELILLMEYFNSQNSVRENIRRVGLVKRTFDQMQTRMELPSEVMQRFSTALSLFNKKRSEYQAEMEKQRVINAEKKEGLIEELRKVVEANDMNRHEEVKTIQKSWKETGQVPKDKMDELNLAFRAQLDQYYQQRKIHFELLDYDREINLKKKESLLEEMKTVVPPEGKREDREAWEVASTTMEAAQIRWKAIGYVPKEELERVIEDYKDVLNQFYSLRREYYESLEQERQENATAKQELLAKMEAFKTYTSQSPREWNDATQELRKLQEEWQKIGPAPRDQNSDLWKNFREIGDAFYGGKTAFFRQLDDMRSANLDAKTKLVEEAEGYKESAEWGKTTRRLQEIQKQWKEIGPVPERHSQKLWNRFRSACDAFFEAKRNNFAGQREEEKRNLTEKKELIGRVKNISPDELGSVDAAIVEIKAIQQEWKTIGHVPFKEKDKIWEEFRKEVDKFFDDLRANRSRVSVARTRAKVEELPEDARAATLKRQIMAVTRKVENAARTVEQYENNMGFIAKGKKGDALRAQINKEIEKERQAIKAFRKELRELRDMASGKKKEEPKPVEAAAPAAEEAPATEAATTEEAAPAAEAAKEDAPAEEATEAPAEETPAAEAEAPAKEEEAPADEDAKKEE